MNKKSLKKLSNRELVSYMIKKYGIVKCDVASIGRISRPNLVNWLKGKRKMTPWGERRVMEIVLDLAERKVNDRKREPDHEGGDISRP